MFSFCVKTNRLKKEAETLIKNAKLDNDIPALITSLEKLWKTHVPLVSEISQIRCRYGNPGGVYCIHGMGN